VSTPFLHRFATHLVHRLRAVGLLELGDDAAERGVIDHLADHLSSHPKGSLLHEVGSALVAAPGVEEFYADDEELAEIISDLDSGAARG
jgi:hypothetical protein